MERTANLVQPEVVDADDLATVDVHDLLVHQVGAQEDFVRPLAERLDVDRRRSQARAGVVQRLDRRPGQEDAPSPRLDHEARDRRVAVADGDDQVRDLADRLALPIAHGPTDRLAQVEHAATSGRADPRRR